MITALVQSIFSSKKVNHRDLIRMSGLFDEAYYLAISPIALRNEGALDHYLRIGGLQGRNPHPLFDGAWYLETNPDVRSEGVNPLVHYLTYGVTEGRNPHPLFSTSWYLKQYPDIRASTLNPLSHYLQHGGHSGFDPHPLFASQWYLDRNPSVAAVGMNPLLHFVQYGGIEQRNPHPSFSTAQYVEHYPDVPTSGIDPLRHWLLIGRQEGRISPIRIDEIDEIRASALFDSQWYQATNPDIGQLDAAEHYYHHGWKEGRNPSPFFDGSVYLKENADIAAASINPLVHWLHYGRNEGRRTPVKQERPARETLVLEDLCAPTRDECVRTDSVDITFSILTPTYNTKPIWLLELFQSLRNQTYGGWEWVICDDCSSRSDTLATLQQIAVLDKRVIIITRETPGGISTATNAALLAANGSYIGLVDHDDLLARDVLSSIRQSILAADDPIDIIYTDECKLSSDGRIYDIAVKPDWSPVFLENTMYIGHLTVYATEFARGLGGFRSEFDGTQDYDLALRASREARGVIHVPCIGYIWRAVPGSTAFSIDEKSYALARQSQAVVQLALALHPDATVRPGFSAGFWRTDYALSAKPPRLTYVIPTNAGSRIIRNHVVDLLLRCLASLEQTHFYPDFDAVVIHNGNLTKDQFDFILQRSWIKLVLYNEPAFNFSRKINMGVDAAPGDYICLLNDDVEAITEQGGATLIGFMEAHPQVGAMAPLCLFEHGSVQHNGIILLEQGPSHAGIFGPPSSSGHSGNLRCRREVFGVTGAMLFMKRSLYRDHGGFDEGLPLNYNDVDLCLKLRMAGLSCVVDPEVQVFHYESSSKTGTYVCEKEELYRRWPNLADPFFNPRFDQRNPAYVLSETKPENEASLDSIAFDRWLMRDIARRSSQSVAEVLRFSVAVSVYNQTTSLLREMAVSIRMQTYRNFELVIVDNGSSNPETLAWLNAIRSEPWVRVYRLSKNLGIAGAMRLLLEHAEGSWFIPVDADDFVTIDALQMIAQTIAYRPEIDIIYSDEFKSDIYSNRFAPYFKTDFDPISIMNCCFPCHLMAMRTERLRDLEAYADDRATWCHDWDTTLRALAAGLRIAHLPAQLYAWRINPGSTASIETGTKPEAVLSQRFVLERAIKARGLDNQLTVTLNDLGTNTGMWKLDALSPVADVALACAEAIWGTDVDAHAVLTGISSQAGWVAILSAEADEARTRSLLHLSAPALWDQLVGVVSGVLTNAGDDRVVWSGGVFTGSGVFDPSLDEVWASGGYFGRLYCQRCVDVAAPVDILIRCDRLKAALVWLTEAGLSVTPNRLVIVLGWLAARDEWLVCVTPSLKTPVDSSIRHYVPIDRDNLAARLKVGPSRWYGDHLDTQHGFRPRPDRSVSAPMRMKDLA